MMKEEVNELAKKYRLPKKTTPEDLGWMYSGQDGKTVMLGDYTLVTGYYYNPDGKNWFAATYTFTSDHEKKLGIEGVVELQEISGETYEDDGHALNWAIMSSWLD